MKSLLKCIIIVFVLFFTTVQKSYAFHLKGGWIQYEYISTDNAAGTNKYKITVRQYLDCHSSGEQIDNTVFLGIYKGISKTLLQTITVPLSYTLNPNKQSFDPCLTPQPSIGDVCYRIDVYETTVDLPFNADGYTLAVQRCCRISGIINVQNSDSYGLTYTNHIPGQVLGNWYDKNNSPYFNNLDTVIICHNTPFTFDFSATDVDGDSLLYSFCDGLTGGSGGQNGNPRPNPPSSPPYQTIAYNLGFSGTAPLGANVIINHKTGIISGIAPNATGDYVIAVCVSEYRNGVLIGTTRKEIHVAVGDCELNAAKLNPEYISCDGYTLTFQNQSLSTSITGYLWSFGDGDTSHQAMPTHTYKDTGVFVLKLSVQSSACFDSAKAIVKVFPGFIPDFNFIGSCYQNPFKFFNNTFAKYGFVDSVHWDFGVAGNADTSILKNPIYHYITPNTYTVKLFAHSNKGCYKDTIKTLTVLDKPPLHLPFKDTLICSIDTLPLKSISNAKTFLWQPNINISNINIPNPLVWPKDTTKYIVTVTDDGCVNSDTITVNVLDFITVDAGPNTSVCLTDGYTMKTVSYALGYLWSPALTLNDVTKKFPVATPTQKTTTYYVTANLGKCQDKDSVTLYTFPYAKVKTIPNDISICYGDTTLLYGYIVADTFYWNNTATLTNINTLNPTAKPSTTTSYILTAQYNSGCLKPVRDTVTVKVIQPFKVFAGNDTVVVHNQPLQLYAQVTDVSDKQFIWNAVPNYLNDIHTQNPIANFGLSSPDSVIYRVVAYTKEHCSDTDYIKIKIFKTAANIFVPSAFTPNNDGKNDIIKPICVGITQLDYFNIYNRWGELVFTTNQIDKGWNGWFKNKKQSAGTYVYQVQGTTFLGKTLQQKGTIVLVE